MKFNNHPCACCGFLTISFPSGDTYEICPVCFWEDDNFQNYDVDNKGGANEISLREAKQNFSKFGVSDLQFIKYVRRPTQDEFPK